MTGSDSSRPTIGEVLHRTHDSESAARLRAIYDAFPDIISVSNRDGRIIEVNAGNNGTLLQLDPDELVGRCFTEFLGPEEARRQLELQRRALAGETVTTEYEIEIGGVRGWAESSGTRLDDEHVLWVTRDVTKRRRAEEELRASEDRYRNIVETAAEGILALDTDYRFTFVNERAEEIFGYERGALLGASLRELLPEHQHGMIDEMRKRRSAGIAERFETQLLRRDGTPVWLLISARPRYDELGNFEGSFSMVADISDLKRAEDEHRQLLRRVGVAEDDERQRLAEGLHDGPIQDLAAMALRLGTLRLGFIDDDEERAARVREIEESIRRAIGDLRDLMFALQPAEPGDAGLTSSLRMCASVIFDKCDTETEVNADLDDEPPPRVATTMYRIGREALVNARRTRECVAGRRQRGDRGRWYHARGRRRRAGHPGRRSRARSARASRASHDARARHGRRRRVHDCQRRLRNRRHRMVAARRPAPEQFRRAIALARPRVRAIASGELAPQG